MKKRLKFQSKIYVKSETDKLIVVGDPERSFMPTCYSGKCLSNLFMNMSFEKNCKIFLGTCRKKILQLMFSNIQFSSQICI